MKNKKRLGVSDELIKRIEKETKLEEYFCINFAKERNLLVNLANYIIKSKREEDLNFSEKEIKENILMKEIDRRIYFNELFLKQRKSNKYKLKESFKIKVDTYRKKYLENKNTNKEREFEEIYSELKNMIISGKLKREKYEELIFKGVELSKKLHWKYLPIYDEQMILNRECIPEDNITRYYNHYHAIEDLARAISGNKINLKEKNGDFTLNKRMEFKVYSSRRNSYIIYQIERTIYGWDIGFLFDMEESLKNGENGLFDNLKHDLIFFPKEGVKYALEILWEKADNGEINLEELKIKLQEVAYWISDVERNLREKQPEWCNYY